MSERSAASGSTVVHLLGDLQVHAPAALATSVDTAVRDALPRSVRRGVRRRAACCDCAAPLRMPPRRTEVTVPVELGPDVVRCVVQAELVRCPDCGRAQLTLAAATTVDALLLQVLQP